MFTGRGLLSSVGATSRSRTGGRSYKISAANETLSHENGITFLKTDKFQTYRSAGAELRNYFFYKHIALLQGYSVLGAFCY